MAAFALCHAPKLRHPSSTLPRSVPSTRPRRPYFPCRTCRSPLSPWSMSRASPDADKPAANGVNLNSPYYKSQRSIVAADKDVTAAEVNALLVAAGKPARDEGKWRRALEHSYVVVHARLLGSGKLVGFARATSDRALNGTIWDLVTDPALPDQSTMARNVISYLLREIRRTVPTCSIALISDPDQVKFFEAMDFVSSPDGITSMVLSPDYVPTREIPMPDAPTA